MDLLVAPKPILDAGKNVQAYYLSFQIGNALLEEGMLSAANAGLYLALLHFINDAGLDVLTGGKTVFMPVSNVMLAMRLEEACELENSSVVLLLDKTVELSDTNLGHVERLKEQGFGMALARIADVERASRYLPQMDYIFSQADSSSITPLFLALKKCGYGGKLIASHVNSHNTFERLSTLGIGLFDGNFYEIPEDHKHNTVSPLQVNYIQLLNQVNHDSFDFAKFAKIVQRDTALAIQFLKMANTSLAGSNNIKSLQHAAAILGQNEIKRWVTTAVASSLSQEKPGEITRISLLRAKFCENLAGCFEMGMHMENLFLTGLFSVLDVILEMPMRTSLDMLRVPYRVREGLMEKDSEFGQVLEFVKKYEWGDWTEISRLALVNNISIRDIYKAYYDALMWYNRLVNMPDNEELEPV